MTVLLGKQPDRVSVSWRDWRVAGPVDLRPASKRRGRKYNVVVLVPPPPAK